LKIISGDLEENVNGLTCAGDMIVRKGLHLSNLASPSAPAFTASGGINVVEGGVKINGGFSSASSAADKSRPMTLRGDEGFLVTTGGMTVTAGGLSLSGYTDAGQRGLTLTTGDFEVAGGGTVIRSGTFVTSGSITNASDRRLKRNIENLCSEDAREVVSHLKGVFYDWNADHPYSSKVLSALTRKRNSSVAYQDLATRRVGFIAQDVQEALPIAVHELYTINNSTSADVANKPNGDLLGVAYIDVIPYLVTSMQGMDAWSNEQLAIQAHSAASAANQESKKSALNTAIQELEEILARAEEHSAGLLNGGAASF